MCAYHVEVQGVTCVAVWEIVAAVSFIQRRTHGGRGGEGRGGPECSIYRIICHAVHMSNGHMLYVNFMIYLIMT